MDDPNTVPPTADPNTQPGGQSYENIVQLQNTTANNLNTARAELDAANAKITSLSTPPAAPPPTTAPPTTNGADSGGGSLFDWAGGQMRTDTGIINPDMVTSLERAGIDATQANNFLGFIEDGVRYREHLNNKLITDTVGTQDSFDAHVQWAQDTMAPQDYSSMAASLNDRNTSLYAMQGLMAKAAEAGFKVGNTTPPSNEPTSLPVSSGSATSTAPLLPNTPESMDALEEALKDPSKMASYQQRIAIGSRL